MRERSDSTGRTEGLAPVHYLFGAGPSGSAAPVGPGVTRSCESGSDSAGSGQTGTDPGDALDAVRSDEPGDGTRWFDPSVDGEEGFLDGAAQESARAGWASQQGARSMRALRPASEPSDDEYGRHRARSVPAEPEAPGAAPPGRAERDEQRRRQRAERDEQRKARRAENVAMHALTRRGQSVQEMRDLLTARELGADEIEAEIERLLGAGLLDDADLAQNLVRSLTERKKLGRSALLAELRRRKLDPIAIEEAVAELDRDDEDQRCLELARQRARQLNSVDDQTAERRLSAFLQRKGYSGDAIRTSVRTALRDERGVRFV
ncbi:RecX family transcriptional regulator [Arenivirga flava]|uniref:Regulatory protein RecX n=1 Tax=Arenivirga flava TaxID=1930060 RepID=A0AA37UL67_9MICO|nr:RecX family transcriptional regulator [Arenivirga flava]GMA27081.1 hypothetical protein GCM10025874_03340 [Arenivirga flava]